MKFIISWSRKAEVQEEVPKDDIREGMGTFNWPDNRKYVEWWKSEKQHYYTLVRKLKLNLAFLFILLLLQFIKIIWSRSFVSKSLLFAFLK